MEDLGLTPETKETKKQKRKETAKRVWKKTLSVLIDIGTVLVLCAVAAGLIALFVALYQNGTREAVREEHNGTVKTVEMIYIPAYTESGKENPAKMVNYIEVECKDEGIIYNFNPLYVNEFIQVGDTVTVYTFHSAKMNFKSDKIQYRWDGELYE